MADALFELSDDELLMSVYQKQGRTLDDLPYTAEFEAIYTTMYGPEGRDAENPAMATRAAVFRRLQNLRKAGKLPRLGRAGRVEGMVGGAPKIEPVQERLLVFLAEEHLEAITQRDRLVYTETFDVIVDAFNTRAGLSLSPYDVWRVLSRLAKQSKRARAAWDAETDRLLGKKVDEAEDKAAAVEVSAVGEVSAVEEEVAAVEPDKTLAEMRRIMVWHLGYSRDRMLHCLDQCNERDIWWRPTPAMNALGNVVLHVCGNLRQWVVTTLRGEPDDRDRAAEFAEVGPIPKPRLVAVLGQTVRDAQAAVESASDAEMRRVRFVQIGEYSGLDASVQSMAHLEGHAQEAIYMTRLRLGASYRFKNVY
ncbi:MAG: DUF1572 family protein [Planctomycetota bacterium]